MALSRNGATWSRATYEERRTERHCMAVDPDNRLVARGLEAEWEKSLRDLETAKTELTRREQQQPRMLGPDASGPASCEARLRRA